MAELYRFTIVVPTYRRREVLLRTLAAIERLERPWPCQLVVVVDGSDDGSFEAAQDAELTLDTTVLWQENAGAAAARNRGAAAAQGEFILFLDDDMIADERLLIEHERHLTAGADAVVGHMPVDPSSPRTVLSLGLDRWASRRLERMRAGDGRASHADLLTGQLSVRRDALIGLDGFDEALTTGGTFGGEDTDFLQRMISHGLRVAAAPEAISSQQYVVTPSANLVQWAQAGRAEVRVAEKHPELAAELVHTHGGDTLRGRIVIAGARRGLSSRLGWLASRVTARADAGHTDLVTQIAFSLLRDLVYWEGAQAQAGPAWPQRRVEVLAYHAVDDVDDPMIGAYAVPPEELRAQLQGLLDDGWHFVTTDEFLDRSSWSALPARSVLLTFDDGYASLVPNALPVLAELGIRPVVLIVTDELGGTNAWDVARGTPALRLLDADGVAVLRAAGWEIGAHSRRHPHLAASGRSHRRTEIGGAADAVAALGSTRPRMFAYPYGEHSRSVRTLVRRAGYGAGLALEVGANHRDRWAYPRVEVLRGMTAGEISARLVGRRRRTWRDQLPRELQSIVRGVRPRAVPGRP